MSVALDLGSSEFRSLRNTDSQLLARRIDAVYTVLPDSRLQRQRLEASGIVYLQSPGQLIVPGNGAHDVSQLQGTPVVPVVTAAEIPVADPVGRQVVASLIAAMLPAQPASAPLVKCFATLPGDAQQGSATHDFIERVLKLQGYQLVAIRSGLALVISQLGTAGYTGLSFAFGAESVSCCLTHAGVPVWEETFRGGARRVEEEFATIADRKVWDREGNQYLDLDGVSRWIRSGAVSVYKPMNDEARLLVVLCRNLMRSFLPKVTRALSSKKLAGYLPTGIPILAGGGMSRIPGFAHMFYDALLETALPVQNAEIRLANPDPHAIARGTLILSLLAQDSPLTLPTPKQSKAA